MSQFRPSVEALEAREVPAVFYWTGAQNTDANNPYNWSVGGAPGLPGEGDVLHFSSTPSVPIPGQPSPPPTSAPDCVGLLSLGEGTSFMVIFVFSWMAFAYAPASWDEPKLGAQPTDLRGRVIAITDTTIKIKPERGLTSVLYSTAPDGSEKRTVLHQDNTQPPITLAYTDKVAPSPLGPHNPQFGHSVARVKVGDIVRIERCMLRGQSCCKVIHIERRPGGTVPPNVIDPRLPLEHRWATKRNNEQWVEEKILPHLGRVMARIRP